MEVGFHLLAILVILFYERTEINYNGSIKSISQSKIQSTNEFVLFLFSIANVTKGNYLVV